MKLSERIDKYAKSEEMILILGEVIQLEAKLTAVECGECGKTLLECDFAECDKIAQEANK